MREKQKLQLPAFGASALLVIFAVLCLTVFAMLSVSTAQAEQRLSDASAAAVEADYAADLEAEKIFARLRAGEQPEQVTRSGDVYSYCCSVSERQQLEVELENADGSWKVLRWQVVAEATLPEQTLPVWSGT